MAANWISEEPKGKIWKKMYIYLWFYSERILKISNIDILKILSLKIYKQMLITFVNCMKKLQFLNNKQRGIGGKHQDPTYSGKKEICRAKFQLHKRNHTFQQLLLYYLLKNQF